MNLPPIDRSGLIATRRDLHQHPELGFEERRTSGLVAERLQRLGYTVRTGVGQTGLVGLRDGVLDAPTVDAAFGIHLWNDLPAGTIALMPGPVMASVDEFEIAILGRGGHAAAPHQAIDPVLIAAHVVTALQSLVSRRRNPFEEGVVSVTQMHAGHAFNVIPRRADLRGTVRTFGGNFYDEAPSLVEETARGIARAFGGDAEVRYRRLAKPLANAQKMTAVMKVVRQDFVGGGR